MSALISTGALAACLGEVVLLDGSHHLPTAGAMPARSSWRPIFRARASST